MASSFRARAGACALLGLTGSALLARAITNRSLSSFLGMTDASHGIAVQKTIYVAAPVGEVYAFWTDYQNFPRFMHNVREVRVHEGVSHWVVAGPAGVPVQWDARIVELEPNALLRWRSTAGSAAGPKVRAGARSSTSSCASG